ncbi:phenylacetic acid degradation protein paaN [Ochrobactrum daejeonense]|uniref:Phenylacetic acid degradation protein paaN n=1 Tax=Brucella daejeonensis TaxID=659015 RepID=A0A7W9AUD5_9HYPH|nr:phenylacetic acid degradation protein PaaN [Brucella daejeonensis]MBB5700760.1 phenylacetic acid degradation protein paaN [Brucella daejeonensis]
MTEFFERHRGLIEAATAALFSRGYWTPYQEIPSGKFYGESAKADGEAAFDALVGQAFDLPGHPETARLGAEISPWGKTLAITYPAAPAAELIAAAEAAAPVWAKLSPEARVGICVEIISRLNAMSFLFGHAVMHTTGQAFPMAFQAGGPHAQDRAMEAIVAAYCEMTRFAAHAIWEKPQGKDAPIRLEKHWTIVPRGLSLVIGCQTFPTWNSFPGLFASLATGNPVIVKPHPNAILPLALTVRVAREVLVEAGLPADVILLGVDESGKEITRELVMHEAMKIIDYTGSSAFGEWVRANAPQADVYTEEAGVNTVTIAATDDFNGMCANLAFSLALYSGQMCTAPQNIYVPAQGIETDQGHKSFDDVAAGIAGAIDRLLSDPNRALGVCGAVANPATLERVEKARQIGRVVRDSTALEGARTASPLIVAVDSASDAAFENEWFGPVVFIVAVRDADEGIEKASGVSARKGAITAALYDLDEQRIGKAIDAFAKAAVNLSINLTGNIFVNQSAAFSDFHVTGGNPAGNASLTDTAFVANRFRRVMWRRPTKN